MNTSSFLINFHNDSKSITADVRPCCNEQNVVDYAIWIGEKLAFTVARDPANTERWVIAMKNSDDEFDDEMIQSIGASIASREIMPS